MPPRKALAREDLTERMKIAETDPTSLGSILMTMGVITHDKLAKATETQRVASRDEQLGHILISLKLCTQEQVHIALQAQKGMRSGNKKERAMAVANLAECLRDRTIAESHRVVERGTRFLRSATGSEHPAVTPAMLAKEPDR